MKEFDELWKKIGAQEIYENMRKAEDCRDLEQCLVNMQANYGISEESARMNVRSCMQAVAVCSSVYTETLENGSGLMDELLAHIAQDEDREQILHQLYFGLTAYEDKELSAMLRGGVSPEAVFWGKYYKKHAGTKDAEVLERDIRNAAAKYKLSEQTMEAFAKKFENENDYLLTALALGEGNMNFKCILTMQAYLDAEGELDMLEAANKACYDAQVQAVADGVGSGMISRETAKKILICAGIAVIAIAVIAVLVHTGKISGIGKAIKASEAAVAGVAGLGENNLLRHVMEAGLATNKARLKTARMKKILATLGILGGYGLTKISGELADRIGKYRVGFTADHAEAVEGARELCREEENNTGTYVPAAEYLFRDQEQDAVRKATVVL